MTTLLRGIWTYSLYLLLVCPTPSLAVEPIHVVFINPGHASHNNPTGAFWPEASRFAQAVANDLGIELEVLHAERDSFRMQTLINDTISRAKQPDYLLLVNERFALNELFPTLDDAGIPFFLAYNHYSKQLDQQPQPRKQHRQWLGALVPDNEYAGYQLAKHLINSLAGKPVQLLAYSGDDVTSASHLRVRGLKQALHQYPHASLAHVTAGEWRYDIPLQKTAGLLRRYPQINAIWAANGPMGLGAMAATQQKDLRLQDVNIASINWDIDEINALKRGDLYASVGGHFMTAGWSLILLYDYHHGQDFIADGGAYQQRKIFEAVTQKNMQNYLPVLQTREWHTLDFRQMSKVLNADRQHYRFSLGEALTPNP